MRAYPNFPSMDIGPLGVNLTSVCSRSLLLSGPIFFVWSLSKFIRNPCEPKPFLMLILLNVNFFTIWWSIFIPKYCYQWTLLQNNVMCLQQLVYSGSDFHSLQWEVLRTVVVPWIPNPKKRQIPGGAVTFLQSSQQIHTGCLKNIGDEF
jgi:hypothetical protein